ncbi:MAG: hypothetical protein HC888_05285 [Candidatus Competibacteraceae bacterium]|nr:hypothetical protein [Candidatus Competibacteraceae bacterium]
MTPDEQFAVSVRYASVPVCLIRCPSGMIAVTEGYNTNFRQTLAIVPEAEVLDYVLALEASAPPPPSKDVLAELDPFDI